LRQAFSCVWRKIAAWEEKHQRSALKVLKGMNTMTEQYSAVRAEAPRNDDPLTQTKSLLVSRAKPGNGVLAAAQGARAMPAAEVPS
jgi:hypothetical protein